MYYVYLLRSDKTHTFYIGSTQDLRLRLYRHNHGCNIATKAGVPWKLLYYEAFPTKALALKRELSLKRYGRGLYELKKRLGFC